MACGCGKKKLDTESGLSAEALRSRGASELDVLREATNSEEFSFAIYNGPTYPHYIPSPTGVITEYGIVNYGMGRKGDKVKVHRLDFEKSNGRLFLPVPLEEGVKEMANNGNEGIRGVEPQDPKHVSNEARSNIEVNKRLEKLAKSEARKAAQAAKPEADEEVEEPDSENDLIALSKQESKPVEDRSTIDDNSDNVPDVQQTPEKLNSNPFATSEVDNSKSKANAPAVTPVKAVETSANAPDTNTATGNPSGATAASNANSKTAKSK